MRPLLLLALLAAAAPTLAEEAAGADLPPPPPPPDVAVAPSPAAAPASPARGAPAERVSGFGLLVDAGVPDGAAIALAYRPIESVRLTLGPSHNGMGFGFQGGIGVVPFSWLVNPSLNLEAGRYLGADLSWLADERGVPDELRPLLRDVGYSYLSAQLGLEVGATRGLSFFLRAGVSWVRTSVHGTATTTSNGTTVELSNPRLTGSLPSVKLGVLYWF